MTISLNVRGFPKTYNALNFLKAGSATKTDIIRYAIKVGYPSRNMVIKTLGKWRPQLLTNMVLGYLDNQLKTIKYFQHLEPSEKTSMSFLLGQAFTLWFAEQHMGIRHLVHVKGTRKYSLTYGPIGRRKKRADRPAAKSRPDFVGVEIQKAGVQYHIFESKGRSGSIGDKLIKKALGQASNVNTINGQKPVTKVAAAFRFSPIGCSGKIEDPDGKDDGWNITFDLGQALERCYSFFLDDNIMGDGAQARGELEVVQFHEYYSYGIDRNILNSLKDRIHIDAPEKFLRLIQSRSQAYEIWRQNGILDGVRPENTSVGLDGMILFDLSK